MTYVSNVNKPKNWVPVSFTHKFDDSPARIGRRILYNFTFDDGSKWATYNTAKALRLVQAYYRSKS